MNTLERIKDEVCKEHGCSSWLNISHELQLQFWPIVCERFARAVALASLKEAAENPTAKVVYEPDGCYILKSSITDEKNIKLL